MRGRGHQSQWRAMAFALALFAITLNFLQPLAHAALMRDGAPSTVWSMFCKSAPDERDSQPGSAPASTVDHECCLGLAHAPALLAPSSAFVLLLASAPALPPSLPVDQTGSAGIRDGPQQPRGPPSLLV
ncbi:DUF2946 family protein [Reyranella sp.]|uniref:DUF2946 family protein n=1 Tax=Reyranella sp. TaxID=1929291 RepID=UPI0025F5BB51|nr:DUF2946 family protein [Reyranella sp.]